MPSVYAREASLVPRLQSAASSQSTSAVPRAVHPHALPRSESARRAFRLLGVGAADQAFVSWLSQKGDAAFRSASAAATAWTAARGLPRQDLNFRAQAGPMWRASGDLVRSTYVKSVTRG